MKIYSYNYNKTHTRVDTDNCICDAVTKYTSETRGHLPGKLFVKRTSLGKPFVEGEKNIHISVTHASSLMLVAVDDIEIGIDCEESVRRVRDAKALAARFFTPSERELLDKCGDRQNERNLPENLGCEGGSREAERRGHGGNNENRFRQPAAEHRKERACRLSRATPSLR